MSFLFWIGGIFLVVRGAQLVGIMRTVLALRGRPGSWEKVDESEVPEHTRGVLEAATQSMARHGRPITIGADALV